MRGNGGGWQARLAADFGCSVPKSQAIGSDDTVHGQRVHDLPRPLLAAHAQTPLQALRQADLPQLLPAQQQSSDPRVGSEGARAPLSRVLQVAIGDLEGPVRVACQGGGRRVVYQLRGCCGRQRLLINRVVCS